MNNTSTSIHIKCHQQIMKNMRVMATYGLSTHYSLPNHIFIIMRRYKYYFINKNTQIIKKLNEH